VSYNILIIVDLYVEKSVILFHQERKLHFEDTCPHVFCCSNFCSDIASAQKSKKVFQRESSAQLHSLTKRQKVFQIYPTNYIIFLQKETDIQKLVVKNPL
jgi:hypothetical protein